MSEWLKQARQANEFAEARYNACCALGLASTPAGGRAAQCEELLVALLAEGDASADEVAADDDFAQLRECGWFRRALGRTGS